MLVVMAATEYPPDISKVLDVVRELHHHELSRSRAKLPNPANSVQVVHSKYDPTFKNFSLLDQNKHMQGEFSKGFTSSGYAMNRQAPPPPPKSVPFSSFCIGFLHLSRRPL